MALPVGVNAEISLSAVPIPSFQRPECLVMPNGVPLQILRSDNAEAVRIDIVIQAGQWKQEKLLQALFTNRLLREGTIHDTSFQLAEKLDYYGAWLELSVSMHHSFLTLYTLRRFVHETCALLHEILLCPIFPEKQLDLIRTNNRNQFLINNQRGDITARRLLYKTIYGNNHPCGRFAELEDFDAIDINDIRHFYQAHYGSSTSSLFLAGDVNEDVISTVSSYFGVEWGSAQKSYPIPAMESFALSTQGSTIRLSMPTQAQASIRMGELMMDVGSEDYYRIRVVNTILGGYFGSRLMKRIREEKGYTYGISSDLITNTRQVLLVINCESVADKADEVIDEVRHEMERLRNELVPDDELAMVRNYMIGEVCRSYEGAFSLIDAFIYTHTFGLPVEHIDRTLRVAATMDSNAIRETARRWLIPDAITSVIVSP